MGGLPTQLYTLYVKYLDLQQIPTPEQLLLETHLSRSTRYQDQPELGTLEWDILNPDRLIHLEINNKRRTSLI